MRTPSAPEAIQGAIEVALRGVHTCMPGTVVAYNSATQTATIQPALTRAVPTAEEGIYRYEKLPLLYGVRVLWPRGGSHYAHFALVPGDGVLLLICESDPNTYLRTNAPADPADLRRFSLANAVALPGFGSALGDVGVVAPKAEIGGDSDAAALASKVNDLIMVLKTWTVAATDGGAALQTAINLAFPGPTVDVGSAVLKVGS